MSAPAICLMCSEGLVYDLATDRERHDQGSQCPLYVMERRIEFLDAERLKLTNDLQALRGKVQTLEVKRIERAFSALVPFAGERYCGGCGRRQP